MTVSTEVPKIRKEEDIQALLAAKPRTGMVDFKIPNPEDVWHHTMEVMVLAERFTRRYFAKEMRLWRKEGMNLVHRVQYLALRHDYAECIAPDVTPSMQIPSEAKFELEHMAIIAATRFIPNGKSVLSSWQEYEEKTTLAAFIASKTDKLQVAVAMARLEDKDLVKKFNPQEFYDNSRDQLEGTPFLKEWDKVYMTRPKKGGRYKTAHLPTLQRSPITEAAFRQMQLDVCAKTGNSPSILTQGLYGPIKKAPLVLSSVPPIQHAASPALILA